MKLKVLFAKWRIKYKSLGKFRQKFGLIFSLVVAFCLLRATLGADKLSMLISGNPAIYANLSILWNDDPLKIHIIDVGQGDATLISYRDKTLLIDAGPPESALSLTRYIQDLGVHRINVLILTHPHDDHLGGAPHLLREFLVDQIFLAHEDSENPLQVEIKALAEEKNIQLAFPFRETSLAIDDLTLTCLHPVNKTYANVNNYSSVWKMSYIHSKFLFLADLEKDEFSALTSGHVDFLRTGHHGSKTSLADTLLLRLTPSVAGISCGLNNSFDHPSKEVLELLRESGVPYFRTDQDGTIVLSGNGNFLRWVH